MDHFKTYTDFLFEYQQEDISLLESLDDYFSIGFEIELDTDHRRINSLPTPPKKVKESVKFNDPSITQRKKIVDIKTNFPNFSKKYFDVLDFHEEESVPCGVELVSSPFNSLKYSKDYIQLFFQDYNRGF